MLNTFGPYVTSRVLAQGGMSVVYLATHRNTGEPVALKTVRVPNEIYLASLRREVHALGKLRHPGVVRIVAEGIQETESGGIPWYAMELLIGETLADVRTSIWRSNPEASGTSSERTTVSLGHGVQAPRENGHHPKARGVAANGQLGRVLTLTRRICVPLAFLHGEGIVHSDIKPQNIFVKPGDVPVIMDFGLAGRVAGAASREVAEVVTKVAGTPAYMAPEQIRLTGIDARTDLYALGCVLYELLTGQPPFVGGHDVLVRHLTREPVAPSQLVDGVPAALDALVLALLAKKPRDRVGHADDVARVLEELGAEQEPYGSTVRARAYVYRPELAGRESAVRELQAYVERPKLGSGACVLVGGESGIGKTFLATEVARRVGSELQVVASTCAPRGALRRGGELQPFQELFGVIADRCIAMGEETTERLLGPRAKILGAFSPRLMRLPGIDALPDPPDLSGPAARETILAALRETVAAFSREQPLLLLLDDLQWADELTFAFLSSLPDRFLEEHPLAILATYRSDEVDRALGELLAKPWVHSVQVGRLEPSTVRALVCDMLAIEAPPDAFVRFLARQSEGNPFFVAEYLRTAVAEGILERSHDRISFGKRAAPMDSGVFEQLQLPRTLRDLVRRRLDSLTASARAACDVASVLGREVDAEVLQSAAGISEVEAMEAVAELLARQVLETRDGGRLFFVHDKLREVTYEDIAAGRRRDLHHAAARALETRPDAEAFAPALAHHWTMAAVDHKALEWLEKAAFQARSHAAYGEAASLFARAIEVADRLHGVPQLRRGKLEAGLANAALGNGDLVATEEHYLRALSLLGHPLPTTRTGWGVLLAREAARQVAHLVGFGRGAVTHDELRDGLREAAIAASEITHRYFYGDDALAMLSAALMSMNLAERASVEKQVPRAYTLVGFVAGMVGGERLATTYFGRARAGAEAGHDTPEHAFALAVESVHRAGQGRWGEAERAVVRADQVLAGVHDPFMRELLLTQRAHVEFYSGRVVEARDRFEVLLREARARGNEQHATWALFSIARSHVALGNWDEALPLLEEARSALAKKPELQSEIICQGLLAHVLARKGRYVEAARTVDVTRSCIARARPTSFAALDGYLGALEAAFFLSDRGA
ncbi:MAG: serine/threonine-protein kinase, partial [Polyangiales bacterium]